MVLFGVRSIEHGIVGFRQLEARKLFGILENFVLGEETQELPNGRFPHEIRHDGEPDIGL